MNFKMKMVAAMTFVLTFSIAAIPQAYAALEYEDGCLDADFLESDHVGANINFLRATFLENGEEAADDQIRVELELCAPPLPDVKYRLRLAYDGSDDVDVPTEISEEDVCNVPYDSGFMYRDDKGFGSAIIDQDPNDDKKLVFIINVVDLAPSLEKGNIINLKADSQFKAEYRGLVDRVPDKDTEEEGCARQFIEFELAPDVPEGGVCNCFTAEDLVGATSIETGSENWSAFLFSFTTLLEFQGDGCRVYPFGDPAPSYIDWGVDGSGDYLACQDIFLCAFNLPGCSSD